MTGDLSRDWLVYVLLAGIIWFFSYVVIKGNQAQKKDRQDKNDKKDQDRVR